MYLKRVILVAARDSYQSVKSCWALLPFDWLPSTVHGRNQRLLLIACRA
jgi:hypothetical protein